MLSKFFLVSAIVMQSLHTFSANISTRFLFAVTSTKVSLPRPFDVAFGNDDLAWAHECLGGPFQSAVSAMDILLWTRAISMLFWLLFVRAEFNRCKKGCVLIAVRYVRDTFGFNA